MTQHTRPGWVNNIIYPRLQGLFEPGLLCNNLISEGSVVLFSKYLLKKSFTRPFKIKCAHVRGADLIPPTFI